MHINDFEMCVQHMGNAEVYGYVKELHRLKVNYEPAYNKSDVKHRNTLGYLDHYTRRGLRL